MTGGKSAYQKEEKTGYEATKAKTSAGIICVRFRLKDNRRKGLQVPDKGTVYVREEAKEMHQSLLDPPGKGLQVPDKGTVYVREEAKEMHQSLLDPRLICSEIDASMKAEPMLCLT
ncbi:hypothetical protein Tco_0772641 [Tanacetum coccineum]|uniref:Uncharacterized protein n=1 Tax=Tanacetum coccineum TaxID=301880 RepID=A0ABQ4ZJC5_9ASTR